LSWIPEGVTHALTHIVHLEGGNPSKLSHAHDEACIYVAWFSRTRSSPVVENHLSQRHLAPLFSTKEPSPRFSL